MVEIGVAYESDLDRVFSILTEVGRELNSTHSSVLESTEVRGIEKFGTSELTIRTTTRVKPGTHGQVARDFRKKIIEAFRRERIEIPYPARGFGGKTCGQFSDPIGRRLFRVVLGVRRTFVMLPGERGSG